MYFYLVSAAITIIVALASFAAYLHWKLHQQKKKQLSFNAELDRRAANKAVQIQKDIQFIAKAYLASQVELSEASLRIHNLANLLGLDGSQRHSVAVFDEIATQIGHIPTHKDWKDLGKHDKKQFLKLFETLEETHTERAKALAHALANGGLMTPN